MLTVRAFDAKIPGAYERWVKFHAKALQPHEITSITFEPTPGILTTRHMASISGTRFDE